ncbi:MAG: hypothetical protein WCG38_07330, partial [Aestuariivirga sp.]
MLLNPPRAALDQDAVALFRSEMPSGAIAAEALGLAEDIAGASPFLRQLMLRDPAFAGRVFAEDADQLMALELSGLTLIDPALSQAEVMALLRQAKKRVALLVAVADLSGRWSVEQVTAALTDFADMALGAVISWLLSDYDRQGKVKLADPSNPQAGCGYV